MKRRVAGAIVSPVLAPAASAQPSSHAVEEAWATNGAVNALASYGGQVFVGGDFTQVGPSTGSAVPISLTVFFGGTFTRGSTTSPRTASRCSGSPCRRPPRVKPPR